MHLAEQKALVSMLILCLSSERLKYFDIVHLSFGADPYDQMPKPPEVLQDMKLRFGGTLFVRKFWKPA